MLYTHISLLSLLTALTGNEINAFACEKQQGIEYLGDFSKFVTMPWPFGSAYNKYGGLSSALPHSRHMRSVRYGLCFPRTRTMRFAAVVVAFTWLLTGVLAVKRQDFKTCAQSGFCRRLRDLPTSESTSPYSIDRGTASWDASTGVWRAAIASSIWPEVSFELQVSVTEAGLARVRVDELAGLRQRYNETGAWALLQEPKVSKNVAVKAEQDAAVLSWEVNGSSRQAKVTFSPLKVELLRDGQVHVAFNEQNLFHMEHFRVKKVGEEVQDTPLTIVDGALNQKREEFKPFMSEDGAWEETFGGKTDSKPKG